MDEFGDAQPQSDSTTLESDPNTSDSLPVCPSCGTPVAHVTAVGPTEAVAGPCGCRVPPDLLARE